MHRGLTRRATTGGRLVAQSSNSLVEDRGVIGVHHGLHGEDVWMPAEGLHGAEDHGLSADLAILLGAPGTGAKPASGCDENGCGTLGSGHLNSNRERDGIEGRRRGTALTMPKGENRVIPVTCGKAVFVAVHLHK